MQCPQCHEENDPDLRFCESCGAKLPRRCPSCGHELKPQAQFCGKCGASVEVPGVRSRVSGFTSPLLAPDTQHPTPEDGERKTITALFADIKGSMELIEDLDPEEARHVIDPALQLMMDAVHRYGGYVAQSTGDGIFALFGAPVAHEDHPQRALYAALRMQEDLKRYSDRTRAEGRLPIQVRVGVNSGEVVVRALATGEGHAEYAPIGHSTSLAARMQALAPIGSIATTEAVRRRCDGYFTFNALGPTPVKGVSEPVVVFEVTGLGPLRTRLQRAVGRGLTKFIGRQAELEALKRAAELAKAEHGQLAAVVGEPGVGKSRLVYEFKAVARAGCLVLETFSVSHGKASAYLPVIELLHAYFRIVSEDDVRTRREKVLGKVLGLDRSLEDTLSYLFAVLGLVEGDDPLAQVEPQLRRRRTLEAIKRLVLRESMQQPLLLICEDLHWIDSETQALLNLLADSIGTARILLLVNYRPEYMHGWSNKTYYTQIRLDALGRESAEEMLGTLLGDTAELGPLKRRIVEQTEGNPFFIEEIVQSLFEEGVLVGEVGAGLKPAPRLRVAQLMDQLHLPVTVQAVLAARIDRLRAEQKDLLQTLAVLGKEFAFSLVRAVTGRGDDELTLLLDALQLAEFIYEHPALADVEYTFKHALTQEVAYRSVLSERRKRLHERAAAALEALAAGQVEDRSVELAHHYSRSGNLGKAVEYLGRAGQRAAQQTAYGEAAAYLNRALDLLRQLPASAAQDRRELELAQSLLEMLWVTKGYAAPETIATTERVAALAEHSGTLAQFFDSVGLRWGIAAASGELPAASGLADQALDLAVREGRPILLALAHCFQLLTRHWRGDLAGGEEHFTAGLAFLDNPGLRQNSTLAVHAFAVASYNAWQLGRAEVAHDRLVQAMAAADPNNPYALAWSEFYAARLRLNLREYDHAEVWAQKAQTRAEKHQFPDVAALSRLVLGRARAQRGQATEGVTLIQQGLAGLLASGTRAGISFYTGLLADAQACAGAIGEAVVTVEQALQANPHELIERPENLRRRGVLRLTLRQTELAEVDFREAIALAHHMGAKAWELRATVSLARLLDQQDHGDEARTMLTEIYAGFTEGFDTADLKEAKALLDELGG